MGEGFRRAIARQHTGNLRHALIPLNGNKRCFGNTAARVRLSYNVMRIRDNSHLRQMRDNDNLVRLG